MSTAATAATTQPTPVAVPPAAQAAVPEATPEQSVQQLTNGRNLIDCKMAVAILNSRVTLTRAHIGQQVQLSIQGSGTFLSAADQAARTPGQAQYFDKYIYNAKANSQEAMGRIENRRLFAEATKSESAGNVVEASLQFNEYLNNVQISFNTIADRGHRFENGDMFIAVVGEVDTKSGHKAIVINDVRYKRPAVVEKVKFDVTALMGDLEKLDQNPIAGATAGADKAVA